MKKLYLIDFDGTITIFDSFILFTFFSNNIMKTAIYWLTVLILLPFKKKEILKELYFENFREKPLNEFNLICQKFEKKLLRNIIRSKFKLFLSTIDEGDKVVVVSASISNYIKPWCNKMNFDLISTELETINGNLTGKFSTLNCNGYEKVKRIKEKYNLKVFEEIHVFGNSKGDIPMMELGTYKYYKFFN